MGAGEAIVGVGKGVVVTVAVRITGVGVATGVCCWPGVATGVMVLILVAVTTLPPVMAELLLIVWVSVMVNVLEMTWG